jgi:hypothetical protein
MEFANLTLILVAGLLALTRSDKERVAFILLVTSALLTALLFFIAARTSILPPLNY